MNQVGKLDQFGADKPWRGSLHIESATILQNSLLPGMHWLLRLAAPLIAGKAEPGQFVHLTVDPQRHLRRPLSLLRVNKKEGWLELLYKVTGQGTGLLSHRKIGDQINLLGPIGNTFSINQDRPRRVLIGGGVGIPPMLFLADKLSSNKPKLKPLVLMGSEVAFPFPPVPSTLMMKEMPPGVIAAMPLLEDRGIPNRLASRQDFPGCYQGLVTELAKTWLGQIAPDLLQEIELFACGPAPMLKAVAALAEEFKLPAQIALEEHMACATGGCAGCVVPVWDDGEKQMKRVCVDGPVFQANRVYPSTPAN